SSHAGGHPTAPSTFDSTSKLVILLIGIAAALIGALAGIFNPFLSHAASTQGAQIDTLFSVLLGISAAIFVIVQGFLLYSIVRFARQPDDESDGPPMRGNARLEFFWTVIPALIVVFIAIFSYRVLADIERPTAADMIVEVTARQFAWEFYYPDQDLKTTELHIPLDRQVHLKMRSADMVHAFWVPEFRIKKDLMPDRVTDTFITGTAIGTYPIVCAELCGAGHAIMRSQVIVQTDAEFKNWMAGQIGAKTRGATAAADPAAYGRQLFNQFGCNACHALADAQAVGVVGPKLDGLAGRAGATVPGQSAEDYVKTAIVKPSEFLVKNFQPVMPQDYGQRMSAAEIEAMVTYLLLQK
ncbi:MAG: cytochrome c oxidase subunit II, partial [Chloroflexi bacterium]|nr:cytochrome c oxidase subunit II [Chloroflexota bacterium]